MYQRIWTPIISEMLETEREPDNKHDRYAVAVLEEDMKCVVGHIPQKILFLCSFLIKRGGQISVKVTGRREHSSRADGGLEVPCKLIFIHKTN